MQECDGRLLKQRTWMRAGRPAPAIKAEACFPAARCLRAVGLRESRRPAGLTSVVRGRGLSRPVGFFAFVAGFVLILGITGCGCSRKTVPTGSTPSYTEGTVVSDRKPLKPEEAQKAARSAFPWLEAGVNVDGKPLSVSGGGKNLARKPGEEFNRRYAEGLQFMETEKLGDALKVFEDIIKNYPGTEEASMAEYRVAQIHFKNKSNQAALEAYKRIVTQYPNSPIAENARAAITYLESFEKHESTYVSPEADDKRRRGF